MARKSALFWILLNFLVFLPRVNAFWRMRCSKIQIGRIDPIVSPGRTSTHSHVISGASNIGINSTYESLYNSSCTSCEIQADKSAYWTPNLYYQFKNGSLINVPNGGILVYYLGRGAARNRLVPFPKGFRMLSGNSLARSYDNKTLTYSNAQYGGRPVADRVSFACLADRPLKEEPYMFRTDCSYGMRAQLHFQSCWDGKNLYKPDNSHVAYLSNIDDGVCPPTHPVPFVHIFMETFYDVNNVDQSDGGRFVWSTGDTTGYGFHGDFFNGWDSDVLERAITGERSCASYEPSDGDLKNCPPLYESNIENFEWQCPQQPNQVGEQVEGLMSKLPGCINITSGPEPASPYDLMCPPSFTQPYITPTVDSQPIQTRFAVPGQEYGNSGWNYLGCTNDTAGIRVLAGNGGASSNGNVTTMTVASCQSFCEWKGFKYAGVEFGRECFCDNRFNPEAPPNFDSTLCNSRCAGAFDQTCGGINRMQIFNNTAFVAPPAPTVAQFIDTYRHQGCYSEGSNGRALRGASDANDTMTVNSCVKYCLGKQFRYAGVEYGRECFCGDRLVDSSQVDGRQCNMPCSGNKGGTQQICGAGNRLNVYYSESL